MDIEQQIIDLLTACQKDGQPVWVDIRDIEVEVYPLCYRNLRRVLSAMVHRTLIRRKGTKYKIWLPKLNNAAVSLSTRDES